MAGRALRIPHCVQRWAASRCAQWVNEACAATWIRWNPETRAMFRLRLPHELGFATDRRAGGRPGLRERQLRDRRPRPLDHHTGIQPRFDVMCRFPHPTAASAQSGDKPSRPSTMMTLRLVSVCLNVQYGTGRRDPMFNTGPKAIGTRSVLRQ